MRPSHRQAGCQPAPCDGVYAEFLGSWSGDFWAYERSKSTPTKPVYRPYRNTITYAQADCMKDSAGDVFIVGHQADSYPAFEGLPAKDTQGLLITGRKADGTPFLRTVGKEGAYDYVLVYKDAAAKLAVWRLSIPASANGPAMSFTTIDGKDFTKPTDSRDVTVTMTVGSADAPMWQGVIAYGSHTRN